MDMKKKNQGEYTHAVLRRLTTIPAKNVIIPSREQQALNRLW